MKDRSKATTNNELRTTNYELHTSSAKLAEKVCQNCRFAKPLQGVPEPMSICCRKEGAARSWWRVDPAGSCSNFEAPHFTKDQIDQIEKTGAKVIPLTQGKVAIVDPDDFERLKQYKWHATKCGRSYYAVRSANGKSIKMHRQITNAPKGLVVDHIDHNGLDNRRANLRLCTKQQNNCNTRSFRHKTSKYKGVFKQKGLKKFRALTRCNRKSIHIGMFESEIDAAKAYDKKARELFGEFAYLNFPGLS